MAKRYFSFANLSEMEAGVELRPNGTLGRHHFIITNKSETHISVSGFNTDGSKAGETTIKQGGSLGYNCGSVWAIKPKSEMTPLQLLRSEFKISKDMVFIIPRSEIKNIELEEMTSAIDDDNPHANHNRFWGNGETWGYTGENCAFSIYHSFHGGVDQRRRVHRIFIVKENFKEGVKECFKALADYSGKGFSNIKHPANGLLFAP
jgi:hypothetical protein